MPARNLGGFFSQHVPLLDPLAFHDPLCFDVRLEPALRADLRGGPIVKLQPVDRDTNTVIRPALPPVMRGAIGGLRYDGNEADECTFLWNDSKDYTMAMLYVVSGASMLWVNAVHVPPSLPHLLHDGDIIHLYSSAQSLHARFVYRQTPFLGCPQIPLAFDVLGTLGRGGSGVVRECRDQFSGERVAIKVMKGDERSMAYHEGYPREYALLKALGEPESMRRYCTEAGLEPQDLAIVGCRAFWFDKRRKERYLVYPLARTDLDQIVTTNGRLGERTAKSVAKQLCIALRYIHASQIAHCDVKPGNILITGPGPTPTPHDDLRVVLADFGCALWEHEFTSMPRSMGTRGCKAPECVNFKKCTSAIDMFALGVSIFFALTGRFPYGYKEPGDIIMNAQQLSVWPLLESVGVSAAGQDWLARALLLDPRTRMTATEALEHAWIAGGELVQVDLTSIKTDVDTDDHESSIYDSDSQSSAGSDEDEDEDGMTTCYACGAKRRRAGSETSEGSGQDMKSKEASK